MAKRRKSIKTRLAERLAEELNINVDESALSTNRGANRWNDEINWDAYGTYAEGTTNAGATVRIFSWHTMTDLARCSKLDTVRDWRFNPYSLEIIGGE